MSTPHPGKWRPVFVTPPHGEQPNVVLDTEHISAHAAGICTDLQNQKWKVLYGYPTHREDQNNKVQTRIWDPENPGEPPAHQDIPDWPIQNSARPTPPGLYMLFVLRHKNQSISGETMIPSIAKIVKLS